MSHSPELEFAVEAASVAGRLCSRVQAELVGSALEKNDRSPVTAADFAGQAVVAKMLSERFPDAVLVGEETAASLQEEVNRETAEVVLRYVQTVFPDAGLADVFAWIDAGRGEPDGDYWTLDPIDGTKGFLRGEQYATALAHVVDGRVSVGVLACPNVNADATLDVGGPGSLLYATVGEGAYMQPLAGGDARRIKVSETEEVGMARLLRSAESGHTNVDQISNFAEALGAKAEPVRLDSQAKYALLAAGQGEVLLRLLSPKRPDYRECVWDQAAGSLILEESGGRVSDLDGKPLDFGCGRTLATNRGVLATNGRLHEAALGALMKIGA